MKYCKLCKKSFDDFNEHIETLDHQIYSFQVLHKTEVFLDMINTSEPSLKCAFLKILFDKRRTIQNEDQYKNISQEEEKTDNDKFRQFCMVVCGK